MNEPPRLIPRLAEREPQALRWLISQYSAELLRLGCLLLSNAMEAEEVVQDVFLSFLRTLDSGNFQSSNGAVRAYLRACVRNRCIDRLRGRIQNEFSLEEYEAQGRDCIPDPRPLPSQWLEEQCLQEQLQKRIYELPALQRAVLILRVLEEESYETIAERLGISIDHVKNTLARGRKRLRGQLQNEWLENHHE